MRVSSESVLVIHDGSPEALIACLVCPDPARVVAWFNPFVSSARKSRMSAAKRQMDLLGLDCLITPGEMEPSGGDRSTAPGGRTTWSLLHAIAAASSRGSSRVIWPVRCGEDPDAGATAADRALIVGRLAALDAEPGRAPERIETPLLDLTLEQMLDLAKDLDAPLDASWWCQRDGSTPCGGCAACVRWRTAIARSKSAPEPLEASHG